jgi:hypothetical protein
MKHHPEPIDRVFGSESYVIRLAREIGGEAIVIDPERLAFPVSGKAVREDPAANWAHIPGLVRPWYQKRVVTFGPESVGKSTLAARLGALCGGPYVPEYGRTYERFRGEGAWGLDDFVRIAKGHLALRAAVASVAGPVLVEDTDPLLTAVWARMLGEASIEAAVFAGVSTVFMGEKFGRLEWVFNGHRERFAAILSYVRTATSVACMGCASPGAGDQGPSEGRILTLCNRHRELRREDEPAFLEALYLGGPPDHPDVKLY